MAEIRVERKRSSSWVWLLLLVAVVAAAAAAYYFYGDRLQARNAPAATQSLLEEAAAAPDYSTHVA